MSFVNDNFAGSSLEAWWSTSDPKGDCTFTVSGGNLEINVASGFHEFFPVITAPIVYQAAPCPTKFDIRTLITTPALDTSLGLYLSDTLVAISPYLAINAYDAAGNITLIVESYDGGSYVGRYFNSAYDFVTNPYIRIVRDGDDWELYSGTSLTNWTLLASWNVAISTAYIGLYGGNFNTAPAVTITFPFIQAYVAPRSLFFGA